MEKLVSRPSGGGAKLGTLDMQSYLEVMTRQLAEIQAQHHQFYASRQERLGRPRNNEPDQMKFGSSEVDSALMKQELGSGSHSRTGQDCQQGSSTSNAGSSGASEAAGRSPSAGPGVARRSLNFVDEPTGTRARNTVDRGSRPSAGARPHGEVRGCTSSPPIPGLGESVAVDQQRRAARGQQQPRPLGDRPSSSHIPTRPPRRPGAATPDSVSTSAPHSISPSSGFGPPSTSNSATPSISSASAYTPRPGLSPAAARSDTESATSSPIGPYAVYEVSGIANVSYSTPQTEDDDRPQLASVSKGMSTPATSGASPSPLSRLARQEAYTSSPSAPSVDDSALAVHGHPHEDTEGDLDTEEDAAPLTLTLAGQAYDGIDSEEDEDEGEGPQQQQQRRGQQTGPHGSGKDVRAAADGFAAVPLSRDRASSASSGQGPQRTSANRNLSPDAPDAAAFGSRPQSHAAARVPLMAASLETEEALRALLASPRFVSAGGAPVGASIDMEGLEVPDAVLAALAKADGMDLDAALGAATAATLRAQLAGRMHQAGGQPTPTSHGRHHHQLGPGALTAAPAAAPRGVDGSSLRSVRNTTGRSALTDAPAAAALPASRLAQQLTLHHGDELRQPCVDASIELEHVDSLSRTIEMSSEELATSGLLRGSAAYAAAAVAAQRAAAQQQGKPVLYSLASRSPGVGAAGTADEGGRRTTADGERRRSTTDGGSRRVTADGTSSTRTTDDGGARTQGPSDVSAAVPTVQRTAQADGMTGVAAAVLDVSASDREAAAAAAASYRHHRNSSTNTASVLGSPAAARQGLDGDSVLFGSPNQVRGAAGEVDAMSGAATFAASPYRPPSPPAGADPAPYMASPTVSHGSSRLKRNSRNTIEDVGLGARSEAEGGEGADCGTDRVVAAALAGASSDATLRPWSAATSKRQLATSEASSGMNSSVNFDLSLTQAAAAFAGGKPTSATSSPTASARHLRAPAPGPLQVPLPQQQAYHQPRQGRPSQDDEPAFSTFSLVALSPSGAQAQVSSHDLSVDEAGQPFSPASSPSASAAAAAALLSTWIGAPDPGVQASGKAMTGAQQVAPPLAAFSRAAALAAALDLGLLGPPSATDHRPRCVGASAGGAAAAPSESDGGALPSARHRAQGSAPEVHHRPDSSRQQQEQQQRLPSNGPRGSASTIQAAEESHAEFYDNLSPGPASVAASAAKLFQLKARRQQQWQSQQGLQGDGLAPHVPAAAQESLSQQLQSPVQQQQRRRESMEHGGHHQDGGPAAANQDRSALTPRRQTAALLQSPAPSNSVAAPSSALPAPSSPLLPEAVAQAIARATTGGQDAASRGELNLGHGIAGLSVAIEAGAVKWAWQTDNQGRPADGQPGDPYARGAESPGVVASRESTLQASSSARERGSLGDSGADWALQHLPPPNWQRFGHVPAGGVRQEAKARENLSVGGGNGPPGGLQQPSGDPGPRQHHQHHQHPPQESQYAAARRHSEYSVPEPSHEGKVGPGAALHHYHSAGGSVSQGPQGQQPQVRAASASDAGAQGGKAMALLRLKQQSIMRHHLGTVEQRESEAFPAASCLGQPRPQQQQQHHHSQYAQQSSAETGYQGQQQQAAGRAVSAGARSSAVALRPQRRASAPRLPQSIAEEPSQYGSSVWQRDRAEPGDPEIAEDPEAPPPQPKAYLRRRSAKVPARKVDWSYVKPRTNSRNPDYYIDPHSPDNVILKTRVSPLTSPKGGVAKQPIGPGAGSYANKKKPVAKALPLSPTAEERSAAPGHGAASRRRSNSNIPPAPVPPAGTGLAGDRPGYGRAGAGGGAVAGRGGGLSPLDDLLAHVNTLLRDFDKVVS